jgi:DNA-binding CsgD family transcriptional regulator
MVLMAFDETSLGQRFNRTLLQAMMDHLPQGVSVVDEQLQLVAWNRRYVELFGYPPGLVRSGRPVADLILFNARRGWCGPGDPELQVARRLAFMRKGSTHASERCLPDGKVVEVRGQRLPGGGFLATFSDITRFRRALSMRAEAAALVSQLTPQQLRVLEMLCSGMQNKQIGVQLNVTEATVKAHMRAIMEKFGASNRTQVVLMAQRLSLEQATAVVGPH